MSCLCRNKKRKDVFLLFKCLDIFFGSWKMKYLSMDLQRDFSLLWLRRGRSAVGQYGLCSRLLLFCAILSYLHSHTKLLFTCSRCMHSQNTILMQNKLVFSLETKSLSRGSSGFAVTVVDWTVHLLITRGYVFEYLWAVLLSPDSYRKKPCYYCFLTTHRNVYLLYAPDVRAELVGRLSRVEGFMFMWENADRLKSQQLVCLNENFIREVLRSRVKLSMGGKSSST